MGLLVPGDKPMIWRGPMLHSVMQQFLRSVVWGELDYLIVDLPPGTGDVQLSLVQTVPLTGAVLITTPSAVALADVRKAIEMFRQVNVEVLGVIENMSHFVCPHCDNRVDIFGQGEGRTPRGVLRRAAAGRNRTRSAHPHWRRYRQAGGVARRTGARRREHLRGGARVAARVAEVSAAGAGPRVEIV